MFERVVVGIDEQTHGRDAIALARVLAAPGAEITFAHVYPAMTAAAMTAAVLSASEPPALLYPESTHDLLVTAIRESGVDANLRWIGSPSVGAGLHAIADDVGADLLVVGCSDRGRLTRTLLGNPTTETLGEASCPVAVAPRRYADTSHVIHRIGVAYDESSGSERAMSYGRQLADEFGAELSAFEVVAPPHNLLEPRRRQFEKTVNALTQARQRIAEHERVEAHVACGQTVEQLTGYSNSIDVLVASSRGAGPVALLIHPSTTAALANVVRCPLLVLTKRARERDAALAR